MHNSTLNGINISMKRNVYTALTVIKICMTVIESFLSKLGVLYFKKR